MPTVKDSLAQALAPKLPAMVVKAMLATLPEAATKLEALSIIELRNILIHVEAGLKVYSRSSTSSATLDLRRVLTQGRTLQPGRELILVRTDLDVLRVQRACQSLCRHFFSPTDWVRLATVASELARNIYMYASPGEIRLLLEEDNHHIQLTIVAEDHGPGIPPQALTMNGSYVSKTGLGRGLVGTKALLDTFEVASLPGHTLITGTKRTRSP
jgi:serine/threonine-protein kinase RsbT